jgi:hypothetical protein
LRALAGQTLTRALVRRPVTDADVFSIHCSASLRMIVRQEPVGLKESKRKFRWPRTDFVDFAGQ